VSPQWVAASEAAGTRALEKRHALPRDGRRPARPPRRRAAAGPPASPRPAASDPAAAPASSAPPARKRRRVSERMAPASAASRDLLRLDLASPAFSSAARRSDRGTPRGPPAPSPAPATPLPAWAQRARGPAPGTAAAGPPSPGGRGGCRGSKGPGPRPRSPAPATPGFDLDGFAVPTPRPHPAPAVASPPPPGSSPGSSPGRVGGGEAIPVPGVVRVTTPERQPPPPPTDKPVRLAARAGVARSLEAVARGGRPATGPAAGGPLQPTTSPNVPARGSLRRGARGPRRGGAENETPEGDSAGSDVEEVDLGKPAARPAPGAGSPAGEGPASASGKGSGSGSGATRVTPATVQRGRARARARAASPPSPWTARRPWDRDPTGKDSVTRRATARARAMASLQGEGPTCGAIAVTGCDPESERAVRQATSALRQLRMCTDGREELLLTHLVVGAPGRRSLKTLLAIACGSRLMSPAWVSACVEEGRWLHEGPFEVLNAHAEAARRARAASEAGEPPPLAGLSVHVHLACPAGQAGGELCTNAPSLRRLAKALGAKAAGAKACDVCVIGAPAAAPPGRASLPRGLPRGAVAVTAEWLLSSAEQYRRLEVADFPVA